MALAFVLAAVLALVDWVGVVRDDRRLRWVGKPGVMVALIAAALLSDGAPTAVRAWFVVALVLSLVGDVALLLPERFFVVGLGAFLLAHLAYIAGMVQLDLHPTLLALIVVVPVVVIGPRLDAGRPRARPTAGSSLWPSYLLVISAMVATAWCTEQPWLIVAASLFFASDATLGWNRFVTPVGTSGSPRRILAALAVMVTYHGGPGLLRRLPGHALTPAAAAP